MTLEELVEVSKAFGARNLCSESELITLTRALELSQEERVNVYVDARHAFPMLQSHGSIWKERGLLTSSKKEIKYATENLKLLKAVQVPLQVAVMHCPGHQKEDTEVARGTNLADRAVKEAAKGTYVMPLVPVLDL